MEDAQSKVRLVPKSKHEQVLKKKLKRRLEIDMPDGQTSMCPAWRASSFLLHKFYSPFKVPLKCHSLVAAFLTIPPHCHVSYSSWHYLNNLHSSSIALLIIVIRVTCIIIQGLSSHLERKFRGAKAMLPCSTVCFQGLARYLACSMDSLIPMAFWWVVELASSNILKGPSAWVHLGLTFRFW